MGLVQSIVPIDKDQLQLNPFQTLDIADMFICVSFPRVPLEMKKVCNECTDTHKDNMGKNVDKGGENGWRCTGTA